jgi:hypothetical protein
MQVIGTCGLCGGAVQVSVFASTFKGPVVKCMHCGAKPVQPFGPVIKMKKSRAKEPTPAAMPPDQEPPTDA